MNVPANVTVVNSGPGVTVTQDGPTVTVTPNVQSVTIASSGAPGPPGVVAATAPATYNPATQTIGVTVGTTGGTVAAGNDARITGALQAGATASGDLSGIYPGPTVARINGVAVTGTPTAGQVPTATSGTAATWQVLPTATTAAPGVVQLDGTAADIAPLGTPTAGATGKAADAGHTHAMPRLDQVAAPTAAVALNAQKITGLANGSAATDAAAFGQIPIAGTTAGTYAAGNDPRIVGTVRAITTPTVTAVAGDVLECDASSNPISVTMPTPTAGARVTVKKTDSTPNAVTIVATVDGGANPTLNYRYESVPVIADGVDWIRVSRPQLAFLADYPATSDARYIVQGSAAGNDLAGNYPNPIVAKVNGVSITGIPSAGNVPVATSSSSSTWQALPSTIDPASMPKREGAIGSPGAGALASPWDHVHPRTWWTPEDHGLITWTQDPATCASGSILPTAGTVNFARVHLPVGASVTNVVLFVSTAGAGLTAGQSFAAIYTSGGTLVAATVDQSAGWSTAGAKMMPLVGGPYPLTAGDYLIAFFSNGTTLPNFVRGVPQAVSNINLSAASSRYGIAATGQTTAMPANIGTRSGASNAWWAALS